MAKAGQCGWVELVSETLDVPRLRALVAHPSAGAVLVFEGTTRDSFENECVRWLEYEAWPEGALRALGEIIAESAQRWPGLRCAIAHRLGRVDVGETSVVVALSGGHREEAYAASRFVIDTLKAKVPIWKREVMANGAHWKANPEGTPRMEEQ
jgi:molybdopterin synthase catalytic subunit